MDLLLPLKSIKYEDVARWENEVDGLTTMITGLRGKDGHYHPNAGFNKFSKIKEKIPEGFLEVPLTMDFIKRFYLDKDKSLLKKGNDKYLEIKRLNDGAKDFLVHCNYGRPFLVYVGEKTRIYKKSEKHYIEDDSESIQYDYYIDLVAEYEPTKIFIGKSPLNEGTEFSGSHGDSFDGNSILLEIGSKKVFIGVEVYEFETKDKILEYYSPVGNNDVPYPFAIGEDNVYFMCDMRYVPKHIYDMHVPAEETDVYMYFYGYKGSEALSSMSEVMKCVKIIQKGTLD